MALQLCLQLAQLRLDVVDIVSALFHDDTFYYLLPAWNAHQLGFVSFDGLHPTNGFHLLWFGLVWVLSGISADKVAFVRLTLAACVVLNAGVHLVILRAFKAMAQPRLAPFASVLWFSLSLSTSLYLRGMENSLHMLVFWAVVWQVGVFFARLEKTGTTSLVPVTLVLVLNVWTRADSAVVSAAVFTACAAALMWRSWSSSSRIAERAKPVVLAGTLAALGGVAQMATYWLLGRSVVPVTAVVKSTSSVSEQGRGLLDGFGALATQTFPYLVLPVLSWIRTLWGPLVLLSLALILAAAFTSRSGSGRAARTLLTVTAAPASALLLFLAIDGALVPKAYLGLIALAILVDLRTADVRTKTLRSVWYAVAFAFVVYHTLALPLGMRFRAYADWYYAPAHVTWLLGYIFVGRALWGAQPDRVVRRSMTFGFAAVAMVLAIAAGTTAISGYQPVPILSAKYRAARWVAQHTDRDTVLASWNAGVLGYFSDRTLINLDGLVNSIDYARALRSPEFRTVDYLHANDVDYVIDWSIPTDVQSALQSVTSFPTGPGLKPVVLYRIAPE